MKIGVVTFPGSLDDTDAQRAVRLADGEPVALWHGDADLRGVDAVVLPGGFSYGDYLRCGAMAGNSPVISQLKAHAARGGYVLGVCNGFQILTETGLLPGALVRNASLHFVCRLQKLKVESANTAFTSAYTGGSEIVIPIAHAEGNYYADASMLDRLEGDGRVAFRYAAGENPNGAARDIAGVLSDNGRVLGMMPHPERKIESAHGGTDGRRLFEGVMETIGA